MLEQQALQSRNHSAAIRGGQMKVGTARRVRQLAVTFRSHVTLQQIELFAQLPDPAAERVEQRTVFEFCHAHTELAQS